MASSVPATTRRTSSVLTNVPSWPCLRIDFRIACVDQYAGFFEMTPIFNLGHPRSLEAAMQVAGEKRVASENDAVNAISALVYRPGKGDGKGAPGGRAAAGEGRSDGDRRRGRGRDPRKQGRYPRARPSRHGGRADESRYGPGPAGRARARLRPGAGARGGGRRAGRAGRG